MTAENFDEYAYLEEQLENPEQVEEKADEPNKSRSRDRDRERKDKDKDGGRDKERSDKKEKDRKDRKSRSERSRSRDKKRDKEREPKKKREKSKSRSPRRQRATSAEREAERQRRREEREAEERQRELEELDRDTRTVFAYNLATKAGERDLFEFFSQAGSVLDVRIIYDRNTPKSKGMAYIEMSSQNEIPGALALTGQMLKGQCVMVKASEAEKNLAWEAAQQQKNQAGSAMAGITGLTGSLGPCKLQVTSIHPNVMDQDLMDIFKPFGEIDMLQLMKDELGNSQGAAIVQYKNTASGMQAIQQLNNLELAGQALQVAIAPVFNMPIPDYTFPKLQDQQGINLDDEGEGLKLDARGRASLMARLAGIDGGASVPGLGGAMPGLTGMGSVPGLGGAGFNIPGLGGAGMNIPGLGGAGMNIPGLGGAAMGNIPGLGGMANIPGLGGANIPGLGGMSGGMPGMPVPGGAAGVPQQAGQVPLEQGLLGTPSPIPTECLLLKNLFDPTQETEEGWWVDIAEDVKEECGKHGPVDHIFVDKDSKGFVYLKFQTVQGSMAAKQALHARWFARRMITAEFQFVAVYTSFFKL